MDIYVKFTKTTHQIWSCHVTLASNYGNFYFSPNSALNVRKSYEIWGKLVHEQKSYRQKTNWGVETPPQVHVPNFGGGVAGSEDLACATLPTTPFDFQGKITNFCHPSLIKITFKITVTPPPPQKKENGKVKITVLQ